MRLIAFLSTLALGISAFASNAPDWVVGSYRLELSSDLKTAVQKLGMTEPYARIMLRPDGTFSYASNNSGNVTGTSGTYELNEHHIKLIANDRFPAQNEKSLDGKAEDGALEIEGLRYVKSEPEAKVAPFVPSPVKIVTEADVVGTWNVHNGVSVDKSIKMIFRDNHTFEFAGMSASSKGRFEIDGDKVTLTWTEVDGEKVEPGTMHKQLHLRDDGFFIDTYHYVRN